MPGKHMLTTLGLAGLLVLGGCASSSLHSGPRPHLSDNVAWTVLPFANNTVTPYAGIRAQHLAASLIGTHGIVQVALAPASTSAPLPVDDDRQNMAQELAWARAQNIRYALTGSVEEWRYKIGLDGEPAVGFTLRLIDVPSGKTLWTAAGSASGNSREGLAVLAQRTLDRMLHRLLH